MRKEQVEAKFSTVTPSNPPVGTAYCLEAQNAASTALVSRCFDLTFQNYETGKSTNVDGFNLMLPYPPGVARIVLKKGATELAVRPVSAHAPVVNVLLPNGGETWAASGAYTITWTASDLDGGPLTYSVRALQPRWDELGPSLDCGHGHATGGQRG